MTQSTRTEHDMIGELEVPAAAYYGVHKLRALKNFPISGIAISIYLDLVRALACVKQAASIANRALELLGACKGDYARLHPLDHVNLPQSTNDEGNSNAKPRNSPMRSRSAARSCRTRCR